MGNYSLSHPPHKKQKEKKENDKKCSGLKK